MVNGAYNFVGNTFQHVQQAGSFSLFALPPNQALRDCRCISKRKCNKVIFEFVATFTWSPEHVAGLLESLVLSSQNFLPSASFAFNLEVGMIFLMGMAVNVSSLSLSLSLLCENNEIIPGFPCQVV